MSSGSKLYFIRETQPLNVHANHATKLSKHILMILVSLLALMTTAQAQSLRLTPRPADPFGSPRPSPSSTGVPQHTSIYFELEMDKPKPGDKISTATVTVTLQAAGQKSREILQSGGN